MQPECGDLRPPAAPSIVARPASLRSHLGYVGRERISGWAWDSELPYEAVTLLVFDNDVQIAELVANIYRKDLLAAGIGTGRHGFEFWFPGGLSPSIRHVIHVRRASDGADLRCSPQTIETAASFDDALQTQFARAVDAVLPGPEQERVLYFIAAHMERLLRKRAESEGKRAARMAYMQFRRRWGGAAPVEEHDGAALRALVIDDDMPDATRNAGSCAILSHMRSLRRLGYEVSFMAANAASPPEAALRALEAEGFIVCRPPFYGSVEEVLRLQNICLDVIYLHRLSNVSKYMAVARQYCPQARVLYSVADLHHLRMARQARIEERPELTAKSRKVRLEECTAAWLADAVLTHSTHEAELLNKLVPAATSHVVPWEVPVARPTAPISQRHGVAFIGGYAHTPNVDAAHFLVDDIMKLVWARDGSIPCLLVGSDMPETVKRLAGPHVVVLGHVPDLGSVFDRVRLTVAPLRYGAGVKGKVLASLAAGIPCVMSPVAAEGIGLPMALQSLVGETEADMAALILKLHGDATACEAAGNAGRSFVAQHFSQAAVDARLAAVVGPLGGTVPVPRLAAAE